MSAVPQRRTGRAPGALRRCAGLALASAVIAASAMPIQHRVLERARADAHETDLRLQHAEVRLRQHTLGASEQRASLHTTRTAVTDHELEAAAVESRIPARRQTRAAEERALEEARRAARSSAERLDEMAAVLGLQQRSIAPLRACLAGVHEAGRRLGAGDRDAAATTLEGVSAACLSARTSADRPALPYDFPDPDVVRATDGRWWAYATNSTAGTVQAISSQELDGWRVEGDALDHLPGWARPGATWAPAVTRHGGRWLLYYTVREDRSGLQCISVAAATAAAGPFRDHSRGPLVCERSAGGSIDPDPVVDEHGRLHLLWKAELDTLGAGAELRAARLDDRGTALAGDPVTLLRASEPWEGRTIEAPSMLRADGYHLLYSGGSWNGPGYAVGAARCESVLGPCRRTSPGPILRSTGDLRGPGGLSVFETDLGPGIAYHAWMGDDIGYPNNRYLHIGGITVVDGEVRIRR